jgi:hypothetical protein
MPEEKKVKKFVKGPDKRTHEINVKGVRDPTEPQGYIPVVFDGTAKELAKKVKDALGLG